MRNFSSVKPLVRPSTTSGIISKKSIVLFRSFSITKTSVQSWRPQNLFDPVSKYQSLNRFQKPPMGGSSRGKPDNSIGILTATGLVIMAGTFLFAPYIFKHVPPFTYFRDHPQHMVYAILGINLGVFGLWRLPQLRGILERYMLLHKTNVYSKWSLIGSAFSHQEFWHLAMNMLALWSFGTSLSQIIGAGNFFSLYMNSAIAGSLFSLWYPRLARMAIFGPSLGASGALFGVFGAFAYLFPHAKILLFVFPIPGGAWVALAGSAIWNAAGCILRWGSFDYAAHLGGTAMGLFYGWYISKMVERRAARQRKRISKWI